MSHPAHSRFDLASSIIHSPQSPYAEAYRALRTNLQFLSLDRSVRTIVVTSPGPGEGKTTITASLAIVLAQAGSRVIAVGADMRKPTLDRAFGMPNDVGLTTVLSGQMPWQDAIQQTAVEGVRILSSGPIPPNPAELLGSERMRELVAALRDDADMVLFDAPPIMSVTDAGVLAQMVDGVLYVVSAGTTPREVAKAGKDQLDKVGARILGTILNRLDRQAGYYYYYSYYDDDAETGPWWRRLLNGWSRNGRSRGGNR